MIFIHTCIHTYVDIHTYKNRRASEGEGVQKPESRFQRKTRESSEPHTTKASRLPPNDDRMTYRPCLWALNFWTRILSSRSHKCSSALAWLCIHMAYIHMLCIHMAYIHIGSRLAVYAYICLRAHMCTYVYAGPYACVCVYIYTYMYMYIYI